MTTAKEARKVSRNYDIIFSILGILMVFAVCACLLTGCSGTLSVDKNYDTDSSFVIVENGASYYIVYHKDTKVMYTMSTGGYNCGSFCLLVNVDGTPMIWEGE